MVWIEIADEIWEVYKQSWVMMGVKTHAGLIRMLERYLKESSRDIMGEVDLSYG